MSRNVIWTPNDIDGFVCASMFRHVHSSGDVLHFYETPNTFKDKFIEWLDTKGDMYDRIYVCGYELDDKFLSMIDRGNMKVIVRDSNTHTSPLEGKLYKFKGLSCANHLYNVFKNSLPSEFSGLAKLCSNISNGDIGMNEFKNLTYFNGIKDPLKNKCIKNLYINGMREFTDDEEITFNRFKSDMRREIRGVSTFEGVIFDNKVRAIIVDSLDIDLYNVLRADDAYDLTIFIYPDRNTAVLKTSGMHMTRFKYLLYRYFRGEALGTKGYGTIIPQLEELLDLLTETP